MVLPWYGDEMAHECTEDDCPTFGELLGIAYDDVGPVVVRKRTEPTEMSKQAAKFNTDVREATAPIVRFAERVLDRLSRWLNR